MQEKDTQDKQEKKARPKVPRWRLFVFGTIYVVVAGMAFLDVMKREPGELNGKKPLWMLASFTTIGIQGFILPAGAIAYFMFGREK